MSNPKYYFFRKNKGLWVVVKNINGKAVVFGSYKSEDTAKQVVSKLKDCNWDKSQLERIQSEVGTDYNFQREQTGKNYTFDESRNSYRVSKIINGQRVGFGDYENEFEAKQVVDLLNHYGWSKDNLPKIHSMLGFENKKSKNYCFDKQRGYWTVFHKDKRYGNYQSEKEAKVMVEELKKVNWDRSKLKDIWWDKQILGTINCKPKYYYYDKSRDQYEVKFGRTFVGRYVTEREAKEAVEKYKPLYLAGKLEKKKKRKAKYYYKEHNRFRVRRTINGEQLDFGSYSDEETAKKIVEKLYEYDWNKDKLNDILKEIKEE